jgi:hypothetical protein
MKATRSRAYLKSPAEVEAVVFFGGSPRKARILSIPTALNCVRAHPGFPRRAMPVRCDEGEPLILADPFEGGQRPVLRGTARPVGHGYVERGQDCKLPNDPQKGVLALCVFRREEFQGDPPLLRFQNFCDLHLSFLNLYYPSFGRSCHQPLRRVSGRWIIIAGFSTSRDKSKGTTGPDVVGTRG